MPDPKDQLTGNIVSTVATAEAVLAHFEQALVQSGFAEGATSYSRLADTLLGQRLWVETSGVPAGARFHAVGTHARAIHALLVPYVEAFRRLSALASPELSVDGLEEPGKPGDSARSRAPAPSDRAPAPSDRAPAPSDPLAGRILDAIDAAGRPVSVTALRASVGVTKAELLAAIDRLADAGTVERRSASGRDLVNRPSS